MPTCDRTRVQRKRILIAAPAALATTYDCPDDAFDGTVSIAGQSYSLLRLYPTVDGYRRRERGRENKGLRFNYNRATFTPYDPDADIEIEITSLISAAAFRVLREVYRLHAKSGLNGGATSLVTIYDYARPDDWATPIAGGAEPVTVRHGSLDLPEMGQVTGRALGPWRETEPVKLLFKQVG